MSFEDHLRDVDWFNRPRSKHRIIKVSPNPRTIVVTPPRTKLDDVWDTSLPYASSPVSPFEHDVESAPYSPLTSPVCVDAFSVNKANEGTTANLLNDKPQNVERSISINTDRKVTPRPRNKIPVSPVKLESPATFHSCSTSAALQAETQESSSGKGNIGYKPGQALSVDPIGYLESCWREKNGL